jgi:hypothetical protein
MNECCRKHEEQIMNIVEQHIGGWALSDEMPDEMPLSLFRELRDNIQMAVNSIK